MIIYYTYNTNHATTLFETTPENVVDGSTSTYGKSAVGADDEHIVTGNDHDGVDHGAILSVAIVVYAYNQYYNHGDFNIIPLFNGTTAGDTHAQGYMYYGAPTTIDITHDTNAPATWTIADLQNLDIRFQWDWDSYSLAYVRLYHVKLRVEYADNWSMGKIDSNTQLMIHGEGVDGGVTVVDSSYNELDMNPGGTHIDDDVVYSAAFGNTILFDGTNDFLYTVDDPIKWNTWNIYSWTDGYFTFGAFVKHDDHAGTEVYFNMPVGGDTNNYIALWNAHGVGLSFIVCSSGSIVINVTGAEIADTNWHHIALIKIGTEYGIYKDGTQIAYADDSSTLAASVGMLCLGAQINGASQQNFFDGNMDHIHITDNNYYGAAPNVGCTDTITVPTYPLKRAIYHKQTTGLI